MKSKALLLTATVALVCGLVGVSAHHPFSATYLFDEQLTIEGEVVALIRRNPHSFVHVMAKDQDDHMRQWAVELATLYGGPDESAPLDVLMVGDRVVVTGSPGRDPGVFRILPQSILRPRDGWRWADTIR